MTNSQNALSMYRFGFFSLLLFASGALFGQANPWAQPSGGLYLKLQEWWVISDEHFTDQGRIDPNVTTGIFNTAIYAEYGFTKRLTGVVYFPFFSRTYRNNIRSGTTDAIIEEGEAINSIGDANLALTYNLLRKGNWTVSGNLLLGLPLGNDSGGRDGSLQTGDGEFNQLIQLAAGYSYRIWGFDLYTSVYVGLNNRTNDFSDELRFGYETGLSLFKHRLWIIGRLQRISSLMNGKTAAESIGTSLFANNTEFTSTGTEVAYYLTDRLGVSASYTRALGGRIIFSDPSYSVGVFYDVN